MSAYNPGRYANYTSRSDVYQFTLKYWTEDLLERYNGCYLERKDMILKGGYLIKALTTDGRDAIATYLTSASTSHSTSGRVTTYVLPALSGNTLPVYATTATFTNVVYIGLSASADALNEYIPDVFSISFNANTGTGTMASVSYPTGTSYTVPTSTFTAPSSKKFSSWNSAAAGTGTSYAVNDIIIIGTTNITLYAQWVAE